MVVPLNDDQHVARGVLCRDEPGLLRAAAASADFKASALAEGVESQAPVAPDRHALGGFNHAWRLGQKARQELAKRSLADKADASTVGFVENRQPGAPRALAHRRLFKITERHQAASKLRARHRVQEVALILGAVERLVQLNAG